MRQSKMSNKVAIRMENVTTGYGKTEILHSLSLSIASDSVSTIIGPNGSGKSTALKAISGILPVWSGEIYANNDPITNTETKEIVKKGVVMLPQGGQVFNEMTIQENLRMGGYLTDENKILEERYDRVYEIFPVLEDRLNQRAGDLSGGQQMMVAIGRALMADPDILLLDEPSAGLAPNLTEDVFNQLEKLKEAGINMIIVEQNVRMVLKIAEFVHIFDQGEVAFEGPTEEFKDSDELMEMYFGTQ